MNVPPYSLRSRLSSTSISVKTPTGSPGPRFGQRSPRKPSVIASVLQLRHVIGTTTSNPSGLSCCDANNTFAYCAGSVAVLAGIDTHGQLTYRYFKARPTAVAVNASATYYDSAPNTPTTRKSIFTSKRSEESKGFGREWLDESGGQTWSARERIKTATCVSLSPDGKMLAVGETGYNPRVLLFSTNSTETPLSIMTDHSIGVRSVAFSADSRYLATLGDVNDGYLYIWTVHPKTGEVNLHSTNKCTVNICDMTWVGQNVITVGTRHVKIWQVSPSGTSSPQKKTRLRMDGDVAASPTPIPLPGRNCLLGKMVDSTFTAIVSTSSETAMVCSDDGYLCLLDLSKGNAELVPVHTSDATVAAISYRQSTNRVVWASNGHTILERDEAAFQQSRGASSPSNSLRLRRRASRPSLLRESLGLSHPKRAEIVALGTLGQHDVWIDADGTVGVTRSQTSAEEIDVRNLTSHKDLIRGVRCLPADSELGAFMTWSKNGEMRFWSLDGRLLHTQTFAIDQISDEDEPGTNELRIVRYTQAARTFLIGDRYGVLTFMSQDPWDVMHAMRAHSAEINDIDIHESTSLVVSCGRDRMVQLFRQQHGSYELIQTCDDHISAVTHVLFNDDGRRLVSCSADRTVIIRERMERDLGGETLLAYISAKVVTLKASPLSMCVSPQDANMLVVSTMDKHIVTVDLSSGGSTDSFKVAQKDSDDTTILNSLCLSNSLSTDETAIVAGFSTIDKSIRVYDLQKGSLLGRDSGHTEGVSDIALLEDEPQDGCPSQRVIVSTGLDSTIMIWTLSVPSSLPMTPLNELTQSQAALLPGPAGTPSKASPASLPPLRKVLSKMDVAEFVRQSSPTRENSPHRPVLRRQTSRLALAASIQEDLGIVPENPPSRNVSTEIEARSPSPPIQSLGRLRKPRTRNEAADDNEDTLGGSPSPPSTAPPTAPTTPKYQRANNGRLRRPPSMPGTLRDTAMVQQRRQSLSTTNDFGSIGMASEQACRMLKTYKKKLQASRGDLDLDDVEKELDTVLRMVRAKKEKTKVVQNTCSSAQANGKQDSDVHGLTTLLEQTTI